MEIEEPELSAEMESYNAMMVEDDEMMDQLWCRKSTHNNCSTCNFESFFVFVPSDTFIEIFYETSAYL